MMKIKNNLMLSSAALFIVGIFFTSYVPDAHACSCAPLTEQEALEKSSASFVGSPVTLEFSPNHNNMITFHIEKPIKNISEDMTEIILTTPTQESACGYKFENHTRYMVHTYENKDQQHLGTSLCSGNQNLGFSHIPMMIDESVLRPHPETVSGYPVDLYLAIAGIISGTVAGYAIIRKKIR